MVEVVCQKKGREEEVLNADIFCLNGSGDNSILNFVKKKKFKKRNFKYK